jgi:hypothetical protein
MARERYEEDAMKRLVEFPSDSGEPILVEVEDVGLAGETRRGLSPSAVVERAQSSFEDPWRRLGLWHPAW